MGNCCEKIKNNDRDFKLNKIFSFEEKGKKDNKSEEKYSEKEKQNPILVINYLDKFR